MIERIDSQVHALAKQQGVLASIQSAAEDVDLDIPLPCAHLCPREIAAREVWESIARHCWTAIHGARGPAKRSLWPSWLASWNPFCGWIRLRDLSIREACRRLDRAIEVVSGIAKPAGRRGWFTQVCHRLGCDSLIVIEDLPRLTGTERLLRPAAAIGRIGTRRPMCISSPRVASRCPPEYAHPPSRGR